MTEDIRLSPRQRQIAILVADGRRNKEIAATLGISKHTVDTQVRRIFCRIQHLYVGWNPKDAVMCWMREGQKERQIQAGAA